MTADFVSPAIRYALLAAFVTASPFAGAATFVINNTNAAGVGFNDASAPNPAAGCNAGETIGACRLRVFTQAANQWGALMQSNVTITMNGAMSAQTCSGTSATLGSTSTNSWHANFTNAPRANTAYAQAEANSLAGVDLSPSVNDMSITFNVSIDAGCLSGVTGWWYNGDPSVPVPADRTPLLPVVFHEIGHGLGFTSGYAQSGASGTGVSGATPIWGYYLFNMATQKLWKDMTNAERAASGIGDPNLVWTGTLTNKWAPKFLGPPAGVIVNSPAGIAGAYEAQTAEFGANVASNPVTADVVLVDDGVVGTGTVNDGCETPFVNAAAVAGKIALIDRGVCTFVIKAKNAQLNGAVGVIIANNAASGLPGMGGTDDTITIPALGSTQALGTAIKNALQTGPVNAKLGTNPGAGLSGTNNNCVRMYAPNPYESGSSVSHFSADAFPNLLMEPALNRTIFDKVDLTLPLFRDIGWKANSQDILFLDSFDPNPCAFAQP